jgi:hypothetical protein
MKLPEQKMIMMKRLSIENFISCFSISCFSDNINIQGILFPKQGRGRLY